MGAGSCGPVAPPVPAASALCSRSFRSPGQTTRWAFLVASARAAGVGPGPHGRPARRKVETSGARALGTEAGPLPPGLRAGRPRGEARARFRPDHWTIGRQVLWVPPSPQPPCASARPRGAAARGSLWLLLRENVLGRKRDWGVSPEGWPPALEEERAHWAVGSGLGLITDRLHFWGGCLSSVRAACSSACSSHSFSGITYFASPDFKLLLLLVHSVGVS